MRSASLLVSPLLLSSRNIPRPFNSLRYNSISTFSSRSEAISQYRRARNLSARYDPTLPLNTSPAQSKATEEAKLQGLSPQGLTNPKSVAAAERLTKQPSTTSSHVGGSTDILMPNKPVPPGPDECCMSGCAVCVHDLYVEALNDYSSSLEDLRKDLRQKGIPESSWPTALLAKSAAVDTVGLDPATKAFMELEQALKNKSQN